VRWPWQEQPAAWEEWLSEQRRAFEAGGAVGPPWIAFPGSEPWSFKQEVSEAWLRQVFLPFWGRRGAEERAAYLRRWPPPDDGWRAALTKHWL